jgi:hypothetical protein
MKAPLIVLTTLFSISFFDGMFGWGLDDGFYVFSGFTMMATLGWMWYLVAKEV